MPVLTKNSLHAAEEWFALLGWEPFDFQQEVWRAYLAGESGLIHSATGTGKTYAAWLGPLMEAPTQGKGLQVLWITPLRALAADTVEALRLPLGQMRPDWEVEARTGDISASLRARQAKRMPQGLVTTPESLSILLSREESPEVFKDLKCVVVDEWHELMASKRGVQTELCLARLRQFAPGMRTWGISATLGNLQESLDTLLADQPGRLVKGDVPKQVVIDSIMPATIDRFPWAGHLGTQMVPLVIDAILEAKSSLIFCNTRSQVEIWYHAILELRPDLEGVIAVHHGSLDTAERRGVEDRLKSGELRAVVCTSSLDLGVDFHPVDRVFQIGSAKGVARLLQRAGRSGHQPGRPSRVTCVPTNALEYIDVAAVRAAAAEGRIEPREGLNKPLDLLSQHLVTVALGTGFRGEEMLAEVRSTHAYKNLSDQEWDWTIDFITRGGETLRAYEEFKRVVETDGVYRVEDKGIAKRHRMSVGTIVSDSEMTVQFLKGGRLGTIEESFLTRLNKGDTFMFAGRALEFVRIHNMTAWVRLARSVKGAIPRWMGGRIALSGELARAIREQLDMAKHGELVSNEMQLMAPLLELQAKWSAIPEMDELLVEQVKTREGHHIFIYPFEGRLVHEGLAALFAHRISRDRKFTFSMACNDYGLELLSEKEAPLEDALEHGLFSPVNLANDIADSLNAAQMARSRFREIARIAGLIFPGYPGMPKSARQLQASSTLFYDVFTKYDPNNLLLKQAHREVLERQLEESRMAQALRRLSTSKFVLTRPPRPTPLAFPIYVDFLRSDVSTETMGDRIRAMSLRFEKEADER